jgi:hypothetical protein
MHDQLLSTPVQRVTGSHKTKHENNWKTNVHNKLFIHPTGWNKVTKVSSLIELPRNSIYTHWVAGLGRRDPVTQLSNKLAMLTLIRTIHTRHRISEAKIIVDVLHLPEPLLIEVGPRFSVQPLRQTMVNIVSRSTKAWLAQYSSCKRLQLFCVSPILQPPRNCNSSDEYKNEITFK